MRESIMHRTIVMLAASIAFTWGSAASLAIVEADVLEAQRTWGDGIVAIGSAHVSGGDARAVAADLIARLYGYDLGPVLFKPTKAALDPFRETPEQALSYFVTGVEPEDHGFALTPWTAVRFENHGIVVIGDVAFAMGHYTFTDAHGADTLVEFTFAYRRAPDGSLRIVVHHSSLPYAAH
jgi:hypothetical protein